MKDIRVTTLDNGLRIATDRIKTVETVSLGMWIANGARHEEADINGIAHLLEHMFFKGTEGRDAFAISSEIEAVGGHINAYTARENTAYHAKVLKEHVPLAVDIIADILMRSVFDEGELTRERHVVLQEIAQTRDTPDDIVFDYFQARAFPDQPLGRPVLGREETVDRLTRDDLRGWRARQYRGASMVFVAAGNVDHDDLVDLVEKHFDGLAAGHAADAEPATYEGGEIRKSRDLEQLHTVLGFAGVPIRDPEIYAVTLLSNLLGGGMSSRLFQEIREKRGLAYSVYGFTSSFGDNGLFGIYAGSAPDRAGELLPALAGELTRLAATLSEDEIESSRAQAKAGLLMALESTGARCEQLAQHLMVFGRALTIEEIVENVEAVDKAQIARLAERIFQTRPTLVLMGPHDKAESFDIFAARFAT